MGRLSALPPELQEKIKRGIVLTEKNAKITLNIAFDYGARVEIKDAVKRNIVDQISPDGIDELSFNKYLYLPETPDPDLIIRTGGQLRLSNFLAWQSIYSELYFTKVLWSDLDRTEIGNALNYYCSQKGVLVKNNQLWGLYIHYFLNYIKVFMKILYKMSVLCCSKHMPIFIHTFYSLLKLLTNLYFNASIMDTIINWDTLLLKGGYRPWLLKEI